MKKNIFLLATLTAVALISCKLAAKKDKDGNTLPEISNVTDANKIIDYTNALMEVMKKYNEAVEKRVGYYDDVENKMSIKGPFFSGINTLDYLFTVKSKANLAFGKAPNALGSDKQFFADSAGLYNKLFREFQTQDSVFEMYIKAEDFKDDKFTKGSEIISKQYEIFPQLIRLRKNLNAKILIVADAAEAVSLKDSPIKDAFKSAKDDLNKAENVANMIADKENFTNADLAAINTAYEGLVASIEKNKNIDKSNLDKERKTDSYNRFYNTLTEKAVEMKPVIRTIKETKKLSDDSYDKIERLYNDIINAYNSWVD